MLRRDAIKGIAGAGALASAGLGRRHAAGNDEQSGIVRFDPDIEPIVRLIEDTPRADCIGILARRLNAGLAYRDFLSALFLAGIRNVNPQPPGFKLHCVFVIHSANQLSLEAPANERLLPLFWALDYFKQAQERDAKEGDFVLREIKGRLPRAGTAWAEYRAGMRSWDEERADRAIASLARNRGGHEVIGGLWRYGARDYRNIGHKAIFTANAWRTLQTIGWRHAEPTLRSLTMGLLDFGTDRRMNGYGFEDQSHLANTETARKTLPALPSDWSSREPAGESPTLDILDAMRGAPPVPASSAVAQALAEGAIGAQEAWDAIHLAASELMLRLPGILGVHCVTSVNALHYAFRMAADTETRLYLLLQAVGWMGQFAKFMSGDEGFRTLSITALPHGDVAAGELDGAADVLGSLAAEGDVAARKALAYATRHADLTAFQRQARSLLFRKAADSHHFKFAAAVFEDIKLVSPAWRPRIFATATYYLCGPQDPDSPAVERARRALG